MFTATLVLAMLPGAGSSPHVVSVAPADGGKLLFVATSSGRAPDAAGTGWVNVWDTTKPELKAVIPDLPADVQKVQPTADGKRFVLIGGEQGSVNRIEVWDTAEKKRLHRFELPANDGAHAVVSPNGNWAAFRPFRAGKAALVVWNTDTGKRAEDLEKGVARLQGSLAFTPDSKHLIVASGGDYTEFDVATGKKAVGWTRKDPVAREFMESEFGRIMAPIPGAKAIATVAATGKRRQSFIVRLIMEKKDWFLGEMWDHAGAPVVSSDGRWLAVWGGNLTDRGGLYVLKLEADGSPVMMDRPANPGPPFAGGDAKKIPAWRELPTGGDANRRAVENEPTALLAFSPDGKRVFTAASNGELRVFDPDTLKLKATVWASEPVKGGLPEWLINTPTGEYVGSPNSEKIFARPGRERDPAKMKEALSGK